jgi:hypothetical protein
MRASKIMQDRVDALDGELSFASAGNGSIEHATGEHRAAVAMDLDLMWSAFDDNNNRHDLDDPGG